MLRIPVLAYDYEDFMKWAKKRHISKSIVAPHYPEFFEYIDHPDQLLGYARGFPYVFLGGHRDPAVAAEFKKVCVHRAMVELHG